MIKLSGMMSQSNWLAHSLSVSYVNFHVTTKKFAVCHLVFSCCRMQVTFSVWLSALLSPPVCDSDWSQAKFTEKSEWVLPLTTTPHQSKCTVHVVVLLLRASAEQLSYTWRNLSQILAEPFARVLIKLFYFTSLTVHRLWCIWHLFSGVLWFWRRVWGVGSDRRGAQGYFHPKCHSGTLNTLVL